MTRSAVFFWLLSCMFMSSAAFIAVALGAMVTTFSTIVFLSFCDIDTPGAFGSSSGLDCSVGFMKLRFRRT